MDGSAIQLVEFSVLKSYFIVGSRSVGPRSGPRLWRMYRIQQLNDVLDLIGAFYEAQAAG